MIASKSLTALLTASLLSACLTTSVPAQAPSTPPAAPPGAGAEGPRGPGWGRGMMMGPGMMGGRAFMGAPGGLTCSPRAAGFAEWRLSQIERAVRLTEPQRKALDDLRAASAKAAETIAAACPAEIPATSTARLALMEKRMEAMLAAIKTVRPAFDAFYATLTDEQKARFDAAGPRRWGWQRGRRGDR